MGIMGMLLGVPIAAAVYRLVREDVSRKERRQEEAAKSATAEKEEEE